MKLRQAANDVMLRINEVALRANGMFQALFVFLEVKNNPLSPLHLCPDLLDLNLRLFCHAMRDKFPRGLGRHLVQNMI